MQHRIKFSREVYALGRNGDFRQAGLAIHTKKRRNVIVDADITFRPLKVDGSYGAARLIIPLTSLDVLIRQLTKIKETYENEKV